MQRFVGLMIGFLMVTSRAGTKKSVPDDPARHEACKGICFLLQTAMMPIFTPWELRERGDAGSAPQTMHEVIFNLNKIKISQTDPKYDRGLFFCHS
ncbi:hypothetical protein LJR034_000476 [Caballeronia sp. LjRoot34]|uniref:hypothetical protein n=1 Tax=Caballeronia sp. LjRoot34 TaxID=3342325 RepID=UPI003ECDAA30